MSDKTSTDPQNESETEDDFRVSALLLNDMKKRLHNSVEKRRKDKINTWIHKLGEVLPFKEAKRESKVRILENLFQYINELKDKCDRLMFASDHTLNEIHVKEIQRLTKRCKELEEKNKSYYRLLETAGISPTSWPQDLQFDRPTKYSRKISEQQLNEFLAKTSEKSNQNNKRFNDFDENNEQISSKKLKSKMKAKKRKDRESKERDLKCSPPTPVLPKPTEQLSPNTSSVSSVSSNQTTSSGPLIILNDHNLSTMSSIEESQRLIVNTSTNAFNGLNTFQIRPSLGPQQLQILGNTIDTNMLSRQLLWNLNPAPPPPQPQATAVLLPNGQLLPIITQPQPQQQLFYATNQGIIMTNSQTQPQNTIMNGQTASIVSNMKTNSISLTQNTNPIDSSPKKSEVKTQKLTTTIEAVTEKNSNKKVNKNIKKQLFVQKVKKSKKDKKKPSKSDENDDNDKQINDKKDFPKGLDSKLPETKNKNEKSLNKSKDKNKSRSPSDKKCMKNENSVKKGNNSCNSLSKQVLTDMCGTTDKVKESSSCDILAKATQSIFSPPPKTTTKQMPNSSNKKVTSISNKTKKNTKSTDNRKDIRINDNKTKSVDQNNKCNNSEMSDNKLDANRVNDRTGNEVMCADKSGTTANKANNADVINDTNKNDNYVRNTTVEHKSKVEKTIAAGNKAEISKTVSDSGVGAQHKTDSLNSSAPETTIHSNDRHSNANHRTQHSFNDQSVANASQNSTSDNTTDNTNSLGFGFSSHQNQTNGSIAINETSVGETQPMMTESELPSLLLSLNDENEVTTESVHSVSNSSLPAFLSLSPEHLNEYLPKDNNNTQNDESARDQSITSNSTEIQFRLNTTNTNVEQHSSVRPQDKGYTQMQQKEQQNYNQYPKSSEHPVSTTQTESRSSYTSNFPTISTLITNDYPDFSLNANKSMFSSNNSTNYLDNLNPKNSSQNNNLIQFPLQNDNSLMQLYPMHSYPIPNYLQNSTTANTHTTNNLNRELNTTAIRTTFLSSNESQSTPVNNGSKGSQNTGQSQTTQSRNQTNVALNPHSKPTQGTQQTQNQTQNQSNGVIAIRAQRNPSTEQLQSQQQQRHTSPVSSVGNSSNKSNSNTNPIQYSNHNSFSSYSAEALIRQNEPSVQHMANNEQTRYNANTGSSLGQRLPQQNLSFNSDRSQSRASISYSAESLIQSNQIPNKTSQRESETESMETNVNTDNRISYYQPNNHNNNTSNVTNNSNNLIQRTDQNNNSNNLFNFDHSLNSRLMTTTSQTCTNNYPQITFNSHLPDLRTTTTTSSEAVFTITSSAPVINTNPNRSNSGSAISNNSSNGNASNSQMSHTLGTPAQPPPQQQQHSPVVYPSNGNQNSNSHQSKRSTNNNFNSAVNPFIQSNTDNYQNTNHSSSYPNAGQPIVETNINPNNSNQYQRNSRNTDLRFGNCLQPTNQNSSSSMTPHNNSNTGCFFANTAPNTTYFPAASTTPFPPLLPSAASPFDPTAPFSTAHRPAMFTNTFMPDFNSTFVNSSAANPLPPISGSNFNINSSVNNNSNNSSNAVTKNRETHPTTSRSASNISRSPNQSKHSKMAANSNSSNTKTKKQTNSKHTDSTNNSSSSRHSNDYFSMNDLMSLTTPNNHTNSRYSNFSSNSQTSHNQSRQPVPSPSVTSSHSTNTKNVTSSADTSSSYSLFRPQSQSNSSNPSGSANFSVNSLQTSNRTAPTTSTASHFGSTSGAAHHSSHATNFHLSNIFPDISSGNAESLSISPMKFPPPVAPMVPPVGPPLSQSAMDPNAYPNHHSGSHQNLYHSHHSSARISTPHNAFNSFLSSGTPASHNPNTHSFDPHITPNNRTPSTPQVTGLTGNSTHPTSAFPTHPHSHHSYPNIVPSFNF